MVVRRSAWPMARSALVSGQLVFTPAANYHGPASFTYTITDGTVSAVATVIGHGHAGQRRAGRIRTTASRSPKTDRITVDVLGNDSDVDGDRLTITHVERHGHHGLVVRRSP